MNLLLPKIWSVKNRVLRADSALIFRAIIITALTVFLMSLVYFGIYWVLKLITSQPEYLFVPPNMTLKSIISFLFYMLIFTNTISALGCMYFSSELNLILSAPIKGHKFFINKLIETLFSSSWMTVVFLIPLLLAFGNFYSANLNYYLVSLLLLMPYFLVPALMAMAIATVTIYLIPVKLRKEAMLVSIGLFFYAIFFLINKFTNSLTVESGLTALDLVKLVQNFSKNDDCLFLPNLISIALGELLLPQFFDLKELVLKIVLIFFATLGFSYLIVSFCYENCFYRASILYNIKKARISNLFTDFLEKFLPQKFFALVDKEIKIVSRDLTQSIQLLMLLGICALYLYSLSIQAFFISKFPDQQVKWWKSFFLILNICVESFVITALSSRFAFSAMSREGKAFWLIRKAPVEIYQIVKAKFWVWYSFVFILSASVFGLASWIYYASIKLLLIKILGLLVINLGLVGLAIGMGSIFAKFNWEHISQVATSFGNLIYMMMAVILIMVDVLLEYLFTITYPKPASFFLLLFLLIINISISLFVIKKGAKSLSYQ